MPKSPQERAASTTWSKPQPKPEPKSTFLEDLDLHFKTHTSPYTRTPNLTPLSLYNKTIELYLFHHPQNTP